MRNDAILAIAAVTLLMMGGPGQPAGAAEDGPIRVQVQEAVGPVGQPTRIRAQLSIAEGYRFIEPLPRGNRVIELSSADDGVSFARRVFRGRLQGRDLTFELEVTPTKPGPHPVNGVFRVSYVTDAGDAYHLRHVSLPMITTVTGTE